MTTFFLKLTSNKSGIYTYLQKHAKFYKDSDWTPVIADALATTEGNIHRYIAHYRKYYPALYYNMEAVPNDFHTATIEAYMKEMPTENIPDLLDQETDTFQDLFSQLSGPGAEQDILDAAFAWCEEHDDWGGIEFQNKYYD